MTHIKEHYLLMPFLILEVVLAGIYWNWSGIGFEHLIGNFLAEHIILSFCYFNIALSTYMICSFMCVFV